jgi:hypothetical protein
MNRKLFTLSVLTLITTGVWAQITTNTVSIGVGYADQKWYSFENGELSTQSKDNWDVAFEITGYSSAILANTQKSNFAVYHAPFSIGNYATLDTVGISNWSELHNSDTTWTIGAFNRGADPLNSSDLGWGVYDMNTHFVMGDSCFVIKVSSTIYKKLKIVSLASGAYNFEYADINGANSFTQTINKSSYTGKNFVYFNFTTNTIVDREPLSSSWDLTFVKYISFVPPSATPYGVTGVLQNKGVTVAQANNVLSPMSYTNFASHSFKTASNEIGYDWKEINMNTFAWDLKIDTVYFISDKPGNIWKVQFTGFGGSTTGNFVFTKEKLVATTVGVSQSTSSISKVTVYPNPSNGSATHLIFSNKKGQLVTVSILDMNGRIISAEQILVPVGITSQVIATQNLESGIYFIRLETEGNFTTQKLIIQ